MTFCKAGEMIFEAIPGSIIQIYALLLAEEKSLGALISELQESSLLLSLVLA